MTRKVLLSPRDNGQSVALSGSKKLYRKRILPKAKIIYMGREINFDDAYLTDLASSFDEHAYDQVAFQLADDRNSHTMDPERFRGEIRSVVVEPDGLWGVVEVTEDGAKVLEQNPNLGVSARIIENYQRSDGKTFPRALNHVLGTLDPRIPGLGAWEKVELSNSDPEQVIDLSTTSYEELERMATRAENIQIVADALDLTPEELEELDFSDEVLASYAETFSAADETSVEAEAEEKEAVAETEEEEANEDSETEAVAEVEDESGEELSLDGLSDAELAVLIETLEAELAAEETATDEVEEVAEEVEAESEEAVAEVEETEEADETYSDEELAAMVAAIEEEEAAEEVVETEAVAEVEESSEPTVDDLTDAQIAQMLADGSFGNGAGDTTNANADTEDTALSDAEIAAFLDDPFAKWTPEPFNMNFETAEAEIAAEESAPAAAAVSEPVTLSNETEDPALSAANQRIAELERQNAVTRFEAEKKDFVRKGVPSYLLDLARPVLTADTNSIELSNGETTVNAADVLRQVLDQVAGYIDLATERGHSFPLHDPEPTDLVAEDKAMAAQWAKEANG